MSVRAPKKISPEFYVCKAIRLERFKDFQAVGIKTVLNCRPDEPGLNFLSAEAQQMAESLGLHYRYIPIQDRLNITDREVAAFAEAFKALPKPSVGYCRTGFRAAVAWALDELDHADRHEIRAQVEGAGYDMSPVCHLVMRRVKILQDERGWFYRVFLA